PERAAAIAAARGTTAERLRARLAGDLDSIVAQATADAPDERYRSAAALADDLARWRDGQPVQARRAERGYRIRRGLRRYWPAVAAGVAAIVFLGYHLASLDAALERTQAERNRARLAEQRAEQSRAQAERDRDSAQAVSRYFVTMFRAASPAATRDGDVSARELLDAAQAQLDEAQATAQSPRAVGAIWQALAQVRHELGDYPAALALQQRAVAAQRSEGDPRSLADALRVEGWANYFLDRPAVFLERMQAADALLERAGLTRDPLYARTSSAMGLGLFINGRPDDAWPYFERSLALGRRLGAAYRDDFVKDLLNAAAAAIEIGQNERARGWLTEAQAAAALQRPRNVDNEIVIGTQLGMTLRKLDRLDAARRQFEPLIRRAEAHYGLGHPRLVYAQVELSALDLAQGRSERVLQRVDSMERLLGHTFSAGHGSIADVHGLRGVALVEIGRLGEGRDVLRRLVGIRGAQTSPETRHLLEAVALARSTCAADLAAAAARLRRAKGTEPWQHRLSARWLADCGPR
ncbi:serine/threonine-protein kinase, partial [Lysobacter humi (ex Lee et al. 2017)]